MARTPAINTRSPKGTTTSSIQAPGLAAWASAVASITSTYGRGKLRLLAGHYYFNAAITLPYIIDLEGTSGLAAQTTLMFTNATNGLIVDGVTGYQMAGSIKDIYIWGSDVGLVGLTLSHLNHSKLVRVYVNKFVRQGIYINYCLLPELNGCLITGCGGPSYAQIEVDNSTCFIWNNTRISGNNTAGDTVAGLRIDRTLPATIIGGAIESTGVMIQLCSKTENSLAMQGVTFIGTDLENPGNNHAFIEAGYGWSGTTARGVIGLTLTGVNFSASGTTAIPYAIKLKHTSNFQITNMASVGVGSGTGTTAFLKLDGTTNAYTSLGVFAAPIYPPLVEENSIIRPDARPNSPWTQAGTGLRLYFFGTLTVNSATPELPVPFYPGMYTANTAPTTINTLLPTGGVLPPNGQMFYINATDANTSIAHLGGSTSCRVNTPTGGTVALTQGRIYQLIYNSNSGHWVLMTQ